MSFTATITELDTGNITNYSFENRFNFGNYIGQNGYFTVDINPDEGNVEDLVWDAGGTAYGFNKLNWRAVNILGDGYNIQADATFCRWQPGLETINWGDKYVLVSSSLAMLFEGCSNLKEINISHIKPKDSLSFSWVRSCFSNCSNLREIDLSSWSLTNLRRIFWSFFIL